MTRKRVLVTGGFGRVASALVPRLLEAGYEVRVLVLHDKLNVNYRDKVDVVVGDLANYDDVSNAVQDVDVVCHLGAVFPPLFFEEQKIIQTNVLGTFNVLQAMKNHGNVNRIVFTSTDAVYATGLSLDQYDTALNEEQELWPNNVYGITKVVNEVSIRKYSRLFNFSYIILRVFWSMRSDEMIRLMFEARNYMDELMEEDKEGLNDGTIVALRSEDGRPFADHITDYRDVALGVFLAIQREDVRNETINIAAADVLDYVAQAPRVAKVLGREYREVRQVGLKTYPGANINKAQRLLGYKPEHSMKDMLEEALGNGEGGKHSEDSKRG